MKEKTKQPLSIVILYKIAMIMGHDFGHACDVCDVVLISLQRRENRTGTSRGDAKWKDLP